MFSVVSSGIWRLSFGEPSPHTPVALRGRPALPTDSVGPASELPWDAARVRFQVSRRGCQVAMPAAEGEDFYGMGLQLKSFRQTGRKKTMRVNADPMTDSGDSHAPVPFFLSTAGYGVLVDTARYASFYFASHDETNGGHAAAAAESDGAGDARISSSKDELYQRRTFRTQRSVVVDIPGEKGVDIYVFGGPTMRDALRRYVLFSGGGALPPLWGLGLFYRGYTENDADATLALARRIRATHLPCDCLGLEPGWQSHAYSCSYTWSPVRFPNPRETVGELRDMGFEVNLWEHAFVHPTAPFHEAMRPYAGNVEVWEGLVPDFSLPEARALFGAHHLTHLFEWGIRGVKLDECDNSDFTLSPWSFPEYSRFPSGMDGEEMHSLFGVLGMRTLLEALEPTGRRTWGNARSAHALAAPYPFVLYSDLYDQADFTRGLASAALSGLLWTPEVRQCASSAELVRRLQLVIFSPMALVNGWMIRNPPWEQVDIELNNQNVPMADAEKITALCRKILQIRMALLPYLYSAFADYAFHGVPPVRPLVLDHPDDPAVRDIYDEFLVGESLLFAPMTCPAEERQVYLPAGKWRHWRDGRLLEGGQSYSMPCPLEDILLFVKDGTLLPWAEPVEHVTPDLSFALTARIYGTPNAACRLYDGDPEKANPSPDAWLECRATEDGHAALSRDSRLYHLAETRRIDG